ncbi:synaptogyrin-2b [Callorhinchus milii]|uniref:Synaptogyrin n=1 Tax=Callorhinchus milii TaxID=7868 RepID=V9L008_CALMI|nr:synaptogyrin-2b [Callorhinchus milii]|eukprot:gi/632943248/ref/XP_007886848.1/ PREDICTED: synaptogyrin-2 [Callorhinchus milii]
MEGNVYGAAKAGGAFDLVNFLKQPQTIARFLSWVFAIVVFGCIVSEGYENTHTSGELKCIFNGNTNACHYGVGIGVTAFLISTVFFGLDGYFPQISNITQRKHIVIVDLVVSASWTFLWFVGFCYLTNQWGSTPLKEYGVDASRANSARAAIAFCFFSIFSWGFQTCFALKRYRMGVEDFSDKYTDPTHDTAGPYSAYPSNADDNYQQPPFTAAPEQGADEYVPPVY